MSRCSRCCGSNPGPRGPILGSGLAGEVCHIQGGVLTQGAKGLPGGLGRNPQICPSPSRGRQEPCACTSRPASKDQVSWLGRLLWLEGVRFNPSPTPENGQSRGLFQERVSHVVLDELIHLSMPQFSRPPNGCDNGNYLVGSLCSLNE